MYCGAKNFFICLKALMVQMRILARGRSESSLESPLSPATLQKQKGSDFGQWGDTPAHQFFPHSSEGAAPTDLASMLAKGVSEFESLEVSDYPTVSLDLFTFNPKKTIDRNLYVYHMGARHFKFGKQWLKQQKTQKKYGNFHFTIVYF